MRFSLAGLFWLVACCGLLAGLLSMPSQLVFHHVLTDAGETTVINDYSLRPFEVAGYVALSTATFFVGLWLMHFWERRSR